MENDINNTLAFDLALQFVPTRTGPVEDAVAQAMERSILHVAVMVCMYLITTALGTLMLFCAGKAKAVPKRKRTSRKDSLSSKTSEDEMAVRVEEEVPDPDDEAKEPDLLQLPISLQYQKAFVVGVYCCNFLLCLAAGVGSTLTGLLSPELGLAWEFYTVHFACGCLWMLAQAALAAYMLPPGRRYANTAFLEATFLGICPVTSDAFDTLKDVSFGFLCFAADNLIVNAVGLISLLWLLMFHAILFRDQAFRQWFAENHVSVLALRTLPADADDSPNPLKIPYSENWPDEVAKMMADKKPTSYFLCTKAGKTIPFVADGAPGELTKTTRVDDADFPIELVCQVQYSDHLAADVKEFMADKSPTSYYLCTRNGKRIPFVADSEPVKLTREPNVDEFPVVFVYQVSWMEWAAGLSAEILQYIYKQLTPLKRKMLLWENLPQGVMACIYLEVVGGSVMVALLNLAVPTVQIICTLALFHPVQRLIVAKFAEQIDIAFQESDLVEFHRLRTEAELDSESGLFREICPHSKRLNGFIPDLDESDEGRRVHEAWARSRWILLDCFDSMRSNPHNAHYGELEIVGELQGKQSTHLEGIVAIFSAFHLEGVEILKMNSNNISSKWSKDLAKGLIRNTTITHLDMSGNHIRAAGTKALLHALGDNDLQFLALCGNDLGLKGAEAVAEYLKKDTTQVEKLLLDDNNFADEGSKVLAEAFKMNQSVRYLHLRGNKIGSAGIQDLLLAVVDNDLLLLALCGNDLGLKGAEAVAKYLKRSDTHVSDLRLDDNNFADEGSEVLAEAFKMNQHVQSLHLRGNKIGSAGIQALSEMLKTNQTLEWFDLSNNNMDLVCLEALATAMSKNRHITELYIFAETKVLMKSPVDSTAYFGSAGESKLIKAPTLRSDPSSRANSRAKAPTLRSNRSSKANSLAKAPTLRSDRSSRANSLAKVFTTLAKLSTRSSRASPFSKARQPEEKMLVVPFLRQCGEEWLRLKKDDVKPDDVFLKTMQAIEGQDEQTALTEMLVKVGKVVACQETTLVLAKIDLRDVQAKELAKAVCGLLKLSKVQIIDLHGNNIGPPGLKALAKAVSQNNKIKKLYIFSERLSYEPFEDLAESEVSTTKDSETPSETLVKFMRRCGKALRKNGKTGKTGNRDKKGKVSWDVFSRVIAAIEGQESKVVLSKMLCKVAMAVVNQENELDLSNMELGDEEAEVLSQAVPGLLQINDVHVITLCNNKIGLDGLKALATAVTKNQALKKLHIFSAGGKGSDTAGEKVLSFFQQCGLALLNEDDLNLDDRFFKAIMAIEGEEPTEDVGNMLKMWAEAVFTRRGEKEMQAMDIKIAVPDSPDSVATVPRRRVKDSPKYAEIQAMDIKIAVPDSPDMATVPRRRVKDSPKYEEVQAMDIKIAVPDSPDSVATVPRLVEAKQS